MRRTFGVVGLAVLLWLAYAVGQQSVSPRPQADGVAAPIGRALVLVGEPNVLPYGPNHVAVVGRVRNSGTAALSGWIRVTLFAEDGRIVATGLDSVRSLPPGEEVTYEATAARPEQWTRVEAKVDRESAP